MKKKRRIEKLTKKKCTKIMLIFLNFQQRFCDFFSLFSPHALKRTALFKHNFYTQVSNHLVTLCEQHLNAEVRIQPGSPGGNSTNNYGVHAVPPPSPRCPLHPHVTPPFVIVKNFSFFKRFFLLSFKIKNKISKANLNKIVVTRLHCLNAIESKVVYLKNKNIKT